MTLAEATVQQQGRGNGADSTVAGGLYRNRGGQLEINSPAGMVDSWTRAGKVFEAYVTSPVATITVPQFAAFDLTGPSFHLGVPSSKTFVLISYTLSNLAVWTTADGVAVGATAALGYTSGGVAATVVNLATVNATADSALGTSAATSVFFAGSSLVAPALSSARVVKQEYYATGNLAAKFEYNILKGDVPLMVHGIGSILVWVKLAAAGATCISHAIWAELDKSELVNN